MKELEKKIYKHLEERNWHNLCPADVAKSIMIEGAELLELFQWENLSLEEVKKNKKKVEQIKDELADVFLYSYEMSILLGFDTEKVILRKLAKVNKKYPAKLMRAGKGGPGTESSYWKIKKEHRKKRKKYAKS